MRFAYRLDADGCLVEPVVLEGEGPFPGDCREVGPPPGGFVRPRWDGSEWVEGGAVPSTAAKLLAAKEAKKRTLAVHAVAEMKALFPGSSPEDAVWEAMLLIGTGDPRVAQMRSVRDRLGARRLAVDAAASPEAVEAVVW